MIFDAANPRAYGAQALSTSTSQAEDMARLSVFEDAASRLDMLSQVLDAALGDALATRGRVLGHGSLNNASSNVPTASSPSALGPALLQTISACIAQAAELRQVCSELNQGL